MYFENTLGKTLKQNKISKSDRSHPTFNSAPLPPRTAHPKPRPKLNFFKGNLETGSVPDPTKS